jgi:hypothetical protein
MKSLFLKSIIALSLGMTSLWAAGEENPPLFSTQDLPENRIPYSSFKKEMSENLKEQAQLAEMELGTLEQQMEILYQLRQGKEAELIKILKDLIQEGSPASPGFIQNFYGISSCFNMDKFKNNISQAVEENGRNAQLIMSFLKASPRVDSNLKAHILVNLSLAFYQDLLFLGKVEEAKKMALETYDVLKEEWMAQAFRAKINRIDLTQ